MSDGPRPPASGPPRSVAPGHARVTSARADPPSDGRLPPYEFPEAQKEVFASLATSMSFVGVCAILFGGLSGVFALGAAYAGLVTNNAALGIAAAIWVVVAGLTGWWMMSAGRSLSSLVRTRGQDIERLMEAVGQLRKVFAFARVVVIVYTMLLMAAAMAVAWCSFAADRGTKCWGLFG